MVDRGVSIIICTYNGRERLPKTLEAICKLEGMADSELIVVDNASTDDTAEYVRDFLNERANFPWSIIHESKQGLSHARLAGIRAARFPILLFCDDDNSLFPDYLIRGIAWFEADPNLGSLGGFGIARSFYPLPSWFEKYQKTYAVGPQAFQNGNLLARNAFVYGAGAFYRKEPMLDLLDRGFVPQLSGRSGGKLLAGDDIEWCWLIRLNGYQIAYDEKLKFDHWLESQRLDTEYYIQIKSGIAAGSAKLFAYQQFLEKPELNSFEFNRSYRLMRVRNRMVYFKNFLKPSTDQSWERRLGLEILNARVQSFGLPSKQVYLIYRQLQLLFMSNSKKA